MNPPRDLSNPIRAELTVTYEHQVHFTHGVFCPDNPLLARLLARHPSGLTTRVLVVCDENLATAQPGLASAIRNYFASWAGQIELSCPPLLIHGGEAAKNTEAGVWEIYRAINRHGLCRHGYVIGLGGGAVLDVVGFAAATAHRGVRHVRLPSTVLGQADAGVGVKNGINAFGKKNFIGAFAPPFAVVNDFELLGSLPEREKREGYIEAIKVALIRDVSFFAFIESQQAALREFEPATVEALIRRCAEAHVRHIAAGGDPFEWGSARPLDFGHWAAHKLEQLSGFRIHHGEAVAIGIALDVAYCCLAGYLDAALAERIFRLLEALGFRLWADELGRQDPDGRPAVIAGLEEFREHLGGGLTVTLLKAIGEGFETHAMDPSRIAEAIACLARRPR